MRFSIFAALVWVWGLLNSLNLFGQGFPEIEKLKFGSPLQYPANYSQGQSQWIASAPNKGSYILRNYDKFEFDGDSSFVNSNSGESHIALIRLDSNLNIVWKKIFISKLNANPCYNAITSKKNGDLILALCYTGKLFCEQETLHLAPDNRYEGALLAKISPDGKFVWKSILDGLRPHHYKKIELDKKENIYLSTTANYITFSGAAFPEGPEYFDGNRSSDAGIFKFAPNGRYLWGHFIGSDDKDFFLSSDINDYGDVNLVYEAGGQRVYIDKKDSVYTGPVHIAIIGFDNEGKFLKNDYFSQFRALYNTNFFNPLIVQNSIYSILDGNTNDIFYNGTKKIYSYTGKDETIEINVNSEFPAPKVTPVGNEYLEFVKKVDITADSSVVLVRFKEVLYNYQGMSNTRFNADNTFGFLFIKNSSLVGGYQFVSSKNISTVDDMSIDYFGNLYLIGSAFKGDYELSKFKGNNRQESFFVARLNGLVNNGNGYVGFTNASTINFKIYPNPVASQLTIQSAFFSTDNVFRLIGLNGQVYGPYPMQGFETKIDLSFIPTGVYNLELSSKVKLLHKEMVIIQH